MQAADSDSEEEMSEGEELRQAAAAMAASRKRKQDAIIDLLTDSDDDTLQPVRSSTARPSAAPANARRVPSSKRIFWKFCALKSSSRFISTAELLKMTAKIGLLDCACMVSHVSSDMHRLVRRYFYMGFAAV